MVFQCTSYRILNILTVLFFKLISFLNLNNIFYYLVSITQFKILGLCLTSSLQFNSQYISITAKECIRDVCIHIIVNI